VKYLLLIILLSSFGFSKNIKINFNELSIKKFIKIVSKSLNKSIYFQEEISGYVNYISNGDIKQHELLKILKNDLDSKGYFLVEEDEFLKIVRKTKNTQIKIIDVVTIKNIEAKSIYEILSKTFTSKYYKEKQLQPTISVNEKTNAIVLIGLKDDINEIKELITKLDIHQQQVYVQAKIIEISEIRTKNLGFKYGLNGFSSNSTNILTFSSALNGASSVSPLSLSELVGYGFGIGSIKDSLSLGIAINLLKQQKALDIVSEPSLLCINNKESSIYVGETRSVVTGTTVGTTTTTNFKREDIGLRLSVSPRISSDNKVTLNINTKIEDMKETDLANDGTPATNKKEVITTAIVNNGQSVILGGLIKNKIESIEDRVPFLGDIPIFGELFKNEYDIKDKINLVIIITPYIVPNAKELSSLRDKLSRLKALEDKIANQLIEKFDKNKQKNTTNQAHQKILKEKFGI